LTFFFSFVFFSLRGNATLSTPVDTCESDKKHAGSRANFATATSFIMRLLLTSTSEMEKRDFHHIISRWRWELRSGGGSAGNVLTSLGLLRLDNWLLKCGIRVTTDNDDI
jgi:hypothetical protein